VSETQRIVEFLGGARTLGRQTGSPLQFSAAIRKGLKASVLRHASDHLAVPTTTLSQHLGLSRRTLSRRTTRLTAQESSRMYRLARIYARAAEVLAGPEAARTWLSRPQRALGGDVPLSLLDNEAGTVAVERLLGRIDDGVVT
jgi:putative toxin-antitoxin system antitoxin component (TIGR02293 family)